MQVVIKRNGTTEPIQFDKITRRLSDLCGEIPETLDYIAVAQETIRSVHSNIQTRTLDEVSARVAHAMALTKPAYDQLAIGLLVSSLHKSTAATFSASSLASQELKPGLRALIASGIFDKMIEPNRDYLFSYEGFKKLHDGYLIKVNGTVVDRPQYLYMRCAIVSCPGILGVTTTEAAVAISLEQLAFIKRSYDLISTHKYTNATPTLHNACKVTGNLMSCFLLGTADNIEGLMKTGTHCALISKSGGGIGIHVSCVRSMGQLIRSTGGPASGIPKQLKIFNDIAVAYDQGGKRKGSFAIYLEPWHGDIVAFLKLKAQQGADSERARDLFYALWVPDAFVKALRDKTSWHLFSEDTAPGLSDVYDGMEVCVKCNWCRNHTYNKYIAPVSHSNCATHEWGNVDAFTLLYNRYVSEGRHVGSINATALGDLIWESQASTGGPYVMFKDHVNRQSNQKNIGTIKSSNLCTEITQYSDDTSYASCCLSSINLRAFVRGSTMDWDALIEAAGHCCRALNAVLDNNDYPVARCVDNAKDLRAIGIGIQGLANVFCMMRIPFDSPEAHAIDLRCMECIYYGALRASCDLAKEMGRPYDGFYGSPYSRGEFKFDMWRKNQARIGSGLEVTLTLPHWDALRADVMIHGVANSLLVAPMPTASTCMILGNNESFEPFHSNYYTKGTDLSKQVSINNHMVEHLTELGMWTEAIKREVGNADGSIQGLTGIPQNVKDIYKTVYEYSQMGLMRRAAIRSAFIDQSYSMNIHLNRNDSDTLAGVFLAGWSLGATTGSYYIRTKAAAKPLNNNRVVAAPEVCYVGCDACSS